MRDLLRNQEWVSRLQVYFNNLSRIYEGHRESRLEASESEVITELEMVLAAITELSARASDEVLTSQPGGARPEEVLVESLERTDQVLSRGVKMRTLYQYSAQFSQPTIAYVEHVVSRGAEVRTSATGFSRVLIFDRKAAVLSVDSNPEGAVIVREPNTVRFIADSFDRAWVNSKPFPIEFAVDQAVSSTRDVREAICRLLTEGLSDRKISQRMGISLRTCQRHVAEIMSELSALNRLHAGYLIAKREIIGEANAGAVEK
ncbi:LuxR C-terminal-related transcriptional regulator [Streptomyces sp. NPDC059853]|uniref:LuxR C-terminal-related transcriptional regulator n=1 Tax=Streptomyces sp. NPDC059853 TaxID=3346973 RepID=UPI0036685D83